MEPFLKEKLSHRPRAQGCLPPSPLSQALSHAEAGGPEMARVYAKPFARTFPPGFVWKILGGRKKGHPERRPQDIAEESRVPPFSKEVARDDRSSWDVETAVSAGQGLEAPNHQPECCSLCKGLRDSGLEASFLSKDAADNHNGGRAAEAPLELESWAGHLRHMWQLQCNAQAVTTLHCAGSEAGLGASSEQVCLATALFPVLSPSLPFRDPNTSVTSVAKQQRSGPRSRPARAGDPPLLRSCTGTASASRPSQVFKELGPKSRTRHPPRGWLLLPTCNTPMQGERLLRCSSSSCTALLPEEGFQNRRRLRDLRQLTKTAMELLEQGKPGQSVELLQKCQLEAKGFLSSKHLLVGEIEDHLAQAHVILGKWQEAATHLRRSIRVVEGHYGPSSIEAGQELFKLAQVLFNGRAILEALQAVEKAEAVLLVQLGPQDTQVQELREMRACLKELLKRAPAEATTTAIL
ncbi:SET and MYND domain-containing protein 4 [Sceloporus undulatus]|uniref:SET and MYND domain-containing protein 4 n=1 Tax=Sceloporus undulatus TaxID=8520 RepID=UPI001C4AB25D|nr:SET and MYND domain-containing protein 4 [Sceloporus undulatus]